MRRIDKLLHIAIIPPFLITLLVLTFVFFMERLGTLSELLITRNASPGNVLLIALTIAPPVLIFTLPLSFLIGTMIGLSGLSSEFQITALRACGVPLRRLLKPILVVGGFVGLITAVLSVVVLPRTNDIYLNIRELIGIRQVTSQIVPRVFNEEFKNVVFYLDDLSVDRQRWDGVFLADNSDPLAPRIVLASSGAWWSDPAGMRLQLHLEHGTIYEVNQQEQSKDNISTFNATDIPIALNHADSGGDSAVRQWKEPSLLRTSRLWTGIGASNPARRRDELIELHKRLALPFSVVGFAFVGLSLGIGTRRGGRTFGSVFGLLLVLLYYSMFIDGMRLATAETLPPWLGLWAANIILLGVGIALLLNAEQSSWFSQCVENWRWRTRLDVLIGRLHFRAIRPVFPKFDGLAIGRVQPIFRARFPKIIDSYVTRGFLIYFFWSIVVCHMLFVVFTLFDLLDEIIRHKIPIAIIINYFVFLTPHILLLTIPIALLLAILILFGILEKGSEVTAMKATGWSLYRLSMPIFLTAGLVCAGVYFMQEYVLPYANQKQDSLRNLIKGRPAQTNAPMLKWIFGESDRIFNYDYFDNKDTFIGLNVYEVDLRRHVIERRVYAKQARISEQGDWILENGWVRDFQPGHKAFVPIARASFAFPERPSYFRKEVFAPRDSAKFTYQELKKYIDYLKQSGYNATQLQVELYSKGSFPLSCLVMALLGLPFSFFMGRRGAFFGIVASIVIAISYWGVFRLFEQMGAYGMLSPMLASWAPDILFGASGLVLLFTIRT